MRTSLVSASLLAFAVAAPAAAQAPLYGTFDLTAGFAPDPFITPITAGGVHDALDLPIEDAQTGASCSGFVNAGTADIAVNYAGGAFLRFGARSEFDVTIIVALPDGTHLCNDDRWGIMPGVDIENPTAGEYKVWVGIVAAESTAPAYVLVSELRDDAVFAAEELPQGAAGDSLPAVVAPPVEGE